MGHTLKDEHEQLMQELFDEALKKLSSELKKEQKK